MERRSPVGGSVEGRKGIELKQVNSAMVWGLGYDGGAQELHVRYRGREGVHVYKGVSEEKAAKIMGSESIGRAMHKHVFGVHEWEEY